MTAKKAIMLTFLNGKYNVDDLLPIKQQRNTKLKIQKLKRRRSSTRKQSPYNQGTQGLTWFGNVPTSKERRGEIFIEEKHKSYNEISLTTLNGGILEFLLNS